MKNPESGVAGSRGAKYSEILEEDGNFDDEDYQTEGR